MDHGSLPTGVVLARTTAVFDAESLPAGLLRAHQLAAGVHGRIRVLAGRLRFVWEAGEGEAAAVELQAGDSLVIPPSVLHHVEPGPDASFVVEFHR